MQMTLFLSTMYKFSETSPYSKMVKSEMVVLTEREKTDTDRL
jgi:hypothetical protein